MMTQNEQPAEKTAERARLARRVQNDMYFGGRRLLLLLIDIACFVLCYAAIEVCNLVSRTPWAWRQLLWSDVIAGLGATLVLLACIFTFRLAFRVYQNIWRYPNVRAYLITVVTDMAGGVLGYAISYILVRQNAGEVWYLGFWKTLCLTAFFNLTTLVIRFLYQMSHRVGNTGTGLIGKRRAKKAGIVKTRVAIVGGGQIGCLLADEMMLNSDSTYVPVCFVEKDIAKVGARINGLPVIGEADRDMLSEKLKKFEVAEVFIALPKLPLRDLKAVCDIYTDMGYKVKQYSTPTTPGLVRRLTEDDYISLLGRDPLNIETSEIKAFYADKTVLITGGGGSIGSELCRQVAACRPKQLIVLDIYENNAYDIEMELKRRYGSELNLAVEIASVRDAARLDKIFDTYRPDIVFHAAAHKHVPLMEHSSGEAIKNNVFGTYNTANAAEKYGVSRFVLVSTDKAVNPTNVMGATKRFCEMILQGRPKSETEFCAVRFGNVLGSNGSVVPLFKRQIAEGGPVTITDKRITRFFMTIPEAVQLVLQAGAMAHKNQIYVLDMGQPVKILDLAEKLIRLSGLEPYEDIEIKEIGLRPGEKLYEELLMKNEHLTKTENSKIFIEEQGDIDPREIMKALIVLDEAVTNRMSDEDLIALIKKLVPTYRSPEQVNNKITS